MAAAPFFFHILLPG
jgi:hypothetical protein